MTIFINAFCNVSCISNGFLSAQYTMRPSAYATSEHPVFWGPNKFMTSLVKILNNIGELIVPYWRLFLRK